ncbi:MAG: hypothetical protein ACREKA_01260 [Candidatus Methylomirabilales bacterium]
MRIHSLVTGFLVGATLLLGAGGDLWAQERVNAGVTKPSPDPAAGEKAPEVFTGKGGRNQ